MPQFQPVRFGKYLLLEKLASGGMAQLFRAKITGVQGFEKLIAIKTILPHLTSEQDLVSSFIDEAKLAALLHHQNVVQIYDFGSLEGSYFISMEYLFGKDLRHTSVKSKEKGFHLSIENALHITSRICSGLDYAHNLKDFQGNPLNIIHRDISPQNILVTYEGDVKIVDFGIAKAARRSTVTQVGMIKGKVAYMSPEQASGQNIDHRSDIFSTGILLYEMVTGKQMFVGADTLQVLAKVCRAEFEPPEVAQGGLPPKVYQILHRALKKDPEERYQSCGEMLADMEECMFELSMRPTARGLSQYMKELFKEEIANEGQTMQEAALLCVEEKTTSEREKEGVGEEKEKPKAEPAEKVPRPEKKRAGAYAVLGVVLLIVIGAVFTLWPKEKKERPAPTPGQEEAAKSGQLSVPKPTEEASPGKGSSTKASKATGKEPDAGTEARALREEALGLVEKNPKEAASLLLKAAKLDPGSAQVHFQLGVVYTKLKDSPKAIESYRKATELDSQLADAFFNLGYIHATQKDYASAEAMYARVVQLAPSYLDEALVNLGIVQEKQGKKKESMDSLERATLINPGNETAKKLLDKAKRK
jgi:serine/threonine protein kinase/Flp pilus assembly protein TadD